jgi:hypothetical protein
MQITCNAFSAIYKNNKELLIRQPSIGVQNEQLTRVELRDIRWTVTTCAGTLRSPYL